VQLLEGSCLWNDCV